MTLVLSRGRKMAALQTVERHFYVLTTDAFMAHVPPF